MSLYVTSVPNPAEFWPTEAGSDWHRKAYPRWLSKSTRLLAIGSCFAVNFSRWIALHGVKVYQPEWGFHYNPATISSELRRSAGRQTPDVIWQTSGSWVDAMRHPIYAPTMEELSTIRDQIQHRGHQALIECSACVITLGLSEVWEQALMDGRWQVINKTPPLDVYNSHLLRSRNLAVEDVKDYLTQIVEIVRSCNKVSVPIVFTVSPVPLKFSFAGIDARVANTRSKAVLLAGLHEFLQNADKNVFYFHAFEMFWGAAYGRGLWQRDARHPTSEAVVSVCQEFIKTFAIEPEEFAGNLDFAVKAV